MTLLDNRIRSKTRFTEIGSLAMNMSADDDEDDNAENIPRMRGAEPWLR